MVKTLVLLTLISFCFLTRNCSPIDESLGDFDTIGRVKSYGYPIEEHFVTNSDGYILRIFRIPYGVQSPAAANKSVVLLLHGLLSSSNDWILLGPERALAYLLADRGYDVWFGNARGNSYSRNHTTLTPTSKDFWNFSWHEIGISDIPAMIDYALKVTGQNDLHYVGHSQGTTAFFVMGAERPEYNKKIRTMQALAPVAFMSNLISPFARLFSPFVTELDWVAKNLGVYEFAPSTELIRDGGGLVCKNKSPIQEVCVNVFFLMFGYDSEQLNRTIIPTVLKNFPAGASTNQLVHYGQEINSARFCKYDYGLLKNWVQYKAFKPPDYKLSRITAPVFLHFSDNDWFVAVKDVEELAGKLGNMAGKYRVPNPEFNHIDFIFATDVKTLLYDQVITLMNMY